MPSRPPPPWMRAVVYLSEDTKEASNDFWFTPQGGTFTVDLTTLNSDAHDIILALKTAMVAVTSNAVTIRGGSVTFNDGTRTIGAESYQPTIGTPAASALPEDVAVVVQKIGNQIGKAGRGRWYFSGAPVTWITGSYLNTTGRTGFDALGVALKTNITAGAVTWVPSHFSPDLGTITPLAATEVVDLLGTRRRRRGPF